MGGSEGARPAGAARASGEEILRLARHGAVGALPRSTLPAADALSGIVASARTRVLLAQTAKPDAATPFAHRMFRAYFVDDIDIGSAVTSRIAWPTWPASPGRRAGGVDGRACEKRASGGGRFSGDERRVGRALCDDRRGGVLRRGPIGPHQAPSRRLLLVGVRNTGITRPSRGPACAAADAAGELPAITPRLTASSDASSERCVSS